MPKLAALWDSLSGFTPWIVYWVLVGNVPFVAAAVLALVVAVASVAMGSIPANVPAAIGDWGSLDVSWC